MAKTESRLQDLSLSGAPAWFGVPLSSDPAPQRDDEAWRWLTDEHRACDVEVSEFPVTEAFIEALFGAHA